MLNSRTYSFKKKNNLFMHKLSTRMSNYLVCLILFFFTICNESMGAEMKDLTRKMQSQDCVSVGRVCIYSGNGAVKARDVALALNKLGIQHRGISRREVMSGEIQNCSVLIIPAGHTASMVKTLGTEGFNRIRAFVSKGGGFIGICAGAYIAADTVEILGHPEGLGIIDINNHRKSGKYLCKISITKPGHPICKGNEGRIRVWYQNGPDIEAGAEVEVLARYTNGAAAVVSSMYKDGRVVVFSPHPEGSIEGNVDPATKNGLKLLKNAVRFTSVAGNE